MRILAKLCAATLVAGTAAGYYGVVVYTDAKSPRFSEDVRVPILVAESFAQRLHAVLVGRMSGLLTRKELVARGYNSAAVKKFKAEHVAIEWVLSSCSTGGVRYEYSVRNALLPLGPPNIYSRGKEQYLKLLETGPFSSVDYQVITRVGDKWDGVRDITTFSDEAGPMGFLSSTALPDSKDAPPTPVAACLSSKNPHSGRPASLGAVLAAPANTALVDSYGVTWKRHASPNNQAPGDIEIIAVEEGSQTEAVLAARAVSLASELASFGLPQNFSQTQLSKPGQEPIVLEMKWISDADEKTGLYFELTTDDGRQGYAPEGGGKKTILMLRLRSKLPGD